MEPSWFGLPILINKKFLPKKTKFLKFLAKKGIETRPIISGNFLNQPVMKIYNLDKGKKNFIGAQEIEDKGFFIGIHVEKISRKQLKFLEENLLEISNF